MRPQNTINSIVKLNGIYDILCALCILKVIDIPILRELHLSMFISPGGELFQHFLAYWIFTNGIIRLFGNDLTISLSYLLEASFFASEYTNQYVVADKTIFVVGSSLLLALLSFPFSDVLR